MPKNDSKQAKSSGLILLNSFLRNTAQQGSVYLIGMVGTGLASFFALPIYARIFVPADYGLLSLALLIVSLGNIIIGNWLTSCTARFLPLYQRINKTDTFYSSVLLSTTLSLAGFIILGILAYLLFRGFLASEFRSLIPLVAALIPLTMLYQISLTVLRMKQKAKRYITGQLVFTYVALIIGMPMAMYLGMGVSGILLGQVIILFILGAIMFRGLFLTGSNIRFSATFLPTVKEFARYGFPAAATSIGTWILYASDRYIIEYFRGTTEVGLYSMGHSVGYIIMMMVSAFILAAEPTLMRTYESDNREITSLLLSRLTRMFILLVLPMAVGILVLASPIIRLLTTPPYYPASIVIPFLALGNFIYGLCLLSYTGLQTAKKSNIMARNWFTAGALNILLNIIFVPKFGFTAAAVTSLVSYAALLTLNVKSVSKYLRWVVMPRSAFNSVLSSIVMGGAIFLVIRISSSALIDCILGLLTGVIVYFGMLVLLKEFSKEDIQQIIGMVKGKLPWARRS